MDEFLDSFLAFETYLKLGLVVATHRLWMPVLRTIVREIKAASDTPRGSVLDKVPPPPPPRAPGDDPWVSVPLARHRKQTAAPRRPQAEGRLRGSVGKTQRGGFRPATRGAGKSSF